MITKKQRIFKRIDSIDKTQYGHPYTDIVKETTYRFLFIPIYKKQIIIKTNI